MTGVATPLPLPPMKTPDVRGLIIEQVVEMAARKGVEDIKLIVANALHRRMTGDEIKHAVGERVHRSFYPRVDIAAPPTTQATVHDRR